MDLSKSEIDRLGKRLKVGPLSEEDIATLSRYRLSYERAFQEVVETLRRVLDLEPAKRSAKTITSIIDKLRRQSIRLSQMQDIAGCRIVLPDIVVQERARSKVLKSFSKAIVDDRRLKPSYGYRALHVIVEIAGKPVEIQIRSQLQHMWAVLSEKLSDFDPAIKYGGGDPEMRELLLEYSRMVADFEEYEMEISRKNTRKEPGLEQRMVTVALEKMRARIDKSLGKVIAFFSKGKR